MKPLGRLKLIRTALVQQGQRPVRSVFDAAIVGEPVAALADTQDISAIEKRSVRVAGAVAPIAVLVKRFPKLSETFILNEILDLEARGHDLRIYALTDPYDEPINPDVAQVRAQVIRIVPSSVIAVGRLLLAHPRRTARALFVAAREFAWGFASPLAQAISLAKHLRTAGVGHLHSHFADRPSAIARVAATLAGIPFSISAHAKDIYTCDERGLAERLKAAQFTVTCTEHNAEHLRSLSPSAKIERVYHGVNLDRLSPTVSASASATPLIVSVGRLRRKKGFDILIEACARLRDRDYSFACEIIGYGPEKDALAEQVAALGLGDRVRLLGKLPHDEVIERVRAARVFALPCRVLEDGDRDGIPNVLLEAMAVKTPVVSTNVSGVPELIRDGVNGLTVLSENVDALASAMQRLLNEDIFARRIAEAGRKTVEQDFSLGKGVARLSELLDSSEREKSACNEVAYILKGFPRLSESFISNEILILERMDLKISIFSIKRGDELGKPVLKELRAPLTYLPRTTSLSGSALFAWLARNLPAHLTACFWLLARRPRTFLDVLRRAIRMTLDYRDQTSGRMRKVFIKEFLQAAFIARGVLKRGCVGHLHGHFCHGATTVTWFVSQLTGIPFSFTAHAKDIYQTKLNPGDLLERKLSNARFVITCTGANHAHLCERGPKGAALHTIYHGLDLSLFTPSLRSVEENAHPLILSVGRFVEKKGFLDLIEACAVLHQRGVGFACRIYGEEGETGPAMREAIEQSGLGGIVSLSGPVPQRELRDIYSRATLFALPCRIVEDGDRDGIPNVLAEAMAMGLPVVTTGISGIPEIVEHCRNGILTPPCNPGALADALADLLSNSETRQTLGAAARSTIAEKFDSGRTTRELKFLMDQALAERQAVSP